MATGKAGPASRFSRAINSEIRALMARRGYNQSQLAQLVNMSQPQISKVVFRNESPLNTNQLEELARVLGDDPSAILERAERALKLSEANDRNNYDLAALNDTGEPDVNEDDYL